MIRRALLVGVLALPLSGCSVLIDSLFSSETDDDVAWQHADHHAARCHKTPRVIETPVKLVNRDGKLVWVTVGPCEEDWYPPE